MTRKGKEKREYLVTARVVLTGAYMVVEAEDADEARRIAEEEADFETESASMDDWTITSVERND